MSDRTRTPAFAPVLAVLFLIASASCVGAQPTPKAPPPERHLDAEIGVGVHWGLANDVPIEDDLYTGIGLAAPISDHFDGEVQVAYWTARDNDDDDDADDDENEARDGVHVNTGFRYYPGTEPDARARFYLSLGASMWNDFREDEDYTLGFTTGPGVRMRAGERSGLLVRVPVLLQIEGGMDPMLLPTLNYFYQF